MWMYVFLHSLVRLIIICFRRSQEPAFALGMSRIEREAKQLHFGLLAGFLAVASAFCLINAVLGFIHGPPPPPVRSLDPPPLVHLFWGTLFGVMTRGALLQRAQYEGIVDLVPGIDIDEDGEPHHRPLYQAPAHPTNAKDENDDVARRVVAAIATTKSPQPADPDIGLNELPTEKHS